MSSSSSSPSSWLPLSSLGSGSFGHVSLALNLLDASLFAVKSSPPSSPPPLLSLLNELHILQSLSSPFIIRCLGAHFSPSSPPILRHLFLEYMDRGSLADLLNRSGGKLHNENLVRHYTRAIIQGLDYLHRNGIVHCDIKSHNILMGSSSGIKIADFGAARRVGETSALDGTMRGTPLWMAPEVIQGVEQGTPSDIWSLGCTVVEMLQGRPPWGYISNLAALFFKVGSSKENPPLPEAISAEAKDFLLKCLQRDPKERATAEELLQHPWLCRDVEEGGDDAGKWCEQASPRSTLKFVQSESESESESEWEDESIMECSVPILGVPCRARCSRSAGDVSVPEKSNWITVKRAEGFYEERVAPAPFMQGGRAGGQVLQVKKGREVSLESAAFLRSRRTIVG